MNLDQAQPRAWYEVWRQALIRPSVAGYRQIVSIPGATALRGFLWTAVSMAVAYAIGALLLAVLSLILLRIGVDDTQIVLLRILDGLFPAVIWTILPVELFAMVSLAVSTLIAHYAARAFGGTGTYDQLVYATAAYAAPLSLISVVLIAVPVLGLVLLLGLSFYAMALNAMVLKAVYALENWRALAANAISQTLVFMIATVIVTLLLPVLAPLVQDILGEVAQELQLGP
jgi:hypothetical protein